MYAGELDDDLTCVRCIVGTAEWATENLGGVWQGSDHKVGVGWTWDQIDGWRPPQPASDCVWDDINLVWDCPAPEPLEGVTGEITGVPEGGGV